MTGVACSSWKTVIDTKQCSNCQYWKYFSEHTGYCDYLNIEGHKRPKAVDGVCPARLEITIRQISA